jgi:CBS domain-containing protein
MKIADIITSKGGRVVTITPTVTVLEAVKIMMEERIGAVVINDDKGNLAGILSERDIVQGLAAHGGNVVSKPVGELMRCNILTCGPEENLLKAMALMTDRRIRHVPVVDSSGRLDGIISVGDVVKGHIEEVESEANALRDYINRS